MSDENKQIAYNVFKSLGNNSRSSDDYTKTITWLNKLLQVPWNIHKTISLESDVDYVKNTIEIFDSQVSFLGK
jgi:ATP-dependent Lon protease